MSETTMKKQALLIGINEYQILPALKYARQDAEAVADSLKQNYCFSDDEVMLLTDARPGLFKPTDKYLIQDHLEKLANQELDLFIFGFWGHGLFRNGKRYLCPMIVKNDRAEHQGLPFDEVQELLSKIRAKNTCMILDCCQTIHDRGEAETLTVSDQTTLANAARDIVLRRKEQIPDFQSNVAILNSCKEGQSAYEWDARQHGLFTAHLLDAMEKSSNSVMQIASYISSNIEKTALELGKEQTPFYKLEGDIVLPVKTKSTPLVTGDVFISYRHCNADLVAPVEEELKRRGISYFIDRVGVNYSMDYSTVITQAIKACKVLMVIWTKEANGSADMLQEIVVAKQLKKRVLPYKLGSFDVTEHDALFYQLSTLSRCEAAEPTPDSVTELINQVELLLPRKTAEPEPPTSNPPEKLKDEDVQKQETEDNNAADTPASIELSQTNQNNQPQSTNWSSFETTIRKFIGKETEVVIPEGVTAIGEKAFKDCASLTSVVIPEGVTAIGKEAFYDCKSLISVVIPDGVTEIGEFAFSGCRSLTSVVIPKGVTKIWNSAFYRCKSLTSVVIPDGVTEIGGDAFAGCSSLTSVVIPKGVTKIGGCAFNCCRSLASVVIPEGVTKIGGSTFRGCESLKLVVIPEDVNEIGDYAFDGCKSITSVAIPERLSKIGAGAFGGCIGLKEWTLSSTHPYFKRDGVGLLTKDGKVLVACLASAKEYQIPEGVTKIGNSAFYCCKSLTSVVIPESVTNIGGGAFFGSSSLTSVEIPEYVTTIGEDAFCGCSSLTSVEIPEGVKEIEYAAFDGCKSLTSVVIPKGVTTIGTVAFRDCRSLTSVVIPKGVTTIKYGAFMDCRSLTSIEIPESVVEIGDYVFSGRHNLTIYAPAGSKAEEYAKEHKIPFQVK